MATIFHSQELYPELTSPKRQARDERLRIPRRMKRNGLIVDGYNPCLNVNITGSVYVETDHSQTSDEPTSPKVIEAELSPSRDQRRERGTAVRNSRPRKWSNENYYYTGQQREMSFGILDYYTDAVEPPLPKAHGSPLAEFDFGLSMNSALSQQVQPVELEAEPVSRPLMHAPRPPPPQVAAPMYSLFPTPGRATSVDLTQRPLNISQHNSSPSLQLREPRQAHPASFNSHRRTDSCNSLRLVPAPAPTNTCNSTNPPRRPLPPRIPSDNPPFQASTHISHPTPLRWSGDSCTLSQGSTTSSAQRESMSSSAPTSELRSVWEDDDDDDDNDDEALPLRKKVASRIRTRVVRSWGSSASASSGQSAGSGAGKAEHRGWLRKWLSCGTCAGEK